jgi:hypothetical protein
MVWPSNAVRLQKLLKMALFFESLSRNSRGMLLAISNLDGKNFWLKNLASKDA